ncbi:hypothetical protein RFI_40184 [Reticulomyxa filosa]|uniref:Uncharacterized protein n=1 Tax=Reticulomyxa filosa TaxID=46433 RepID=X6L9F8_RETFI|nr:hypothetical protein RFI_40184 [Reticulomyxa filosa]|eukprot:ETN97349.1 hypothetical protein RFI_40184 [Reticulomyxa filosa]
MTDFPPLPSLPLETERSIGETMEAAAGGSDMSDMVNRIPSDVIMPPAQAVPYAAPITINAQITLVPADDGKGDNVPPEEEREPNIRLPELNVLPPVKDENSSKKRKLKCVLICSWLILLIPALVTLMDYVASVQLMRFIDSSRGDYHQAKKVLRSMSKETIVNQVLICNASGASDTDLTFAKVKT